MDKEDVVHIYAVEYYSAIKRSEIGSFVEMWMDLETVIQSEVSQKERNKIYINNTKNCGWVNRVKHFKIFLHHSKSSKYSNLREIVRSQGYIFKTMKIKM